MKRGVRSPSPVGPHTAAFLTCDVTVVGCGSCGARAHIQYCKCPGARHRTAHSTLSRGSSHFALSRPHAPALDGTAGSSLSRVASPPILARRATPPTGKHGPLPPALDFYAPRLSSLTLHSRAQRAPPPVRTCITCSCSWDRHENGNPHAVYSRGQGAAARADAPSPWRALPAQCAHDSARRGGWSSPRLVMTRLISVFRVPFE